MTNLGFAIVFHGRRQPADTWRVRRMAFGVVLGFVCAAAIRVFDFWPVELASDLRAFLDLLGTPLLLLATLTVMLAWLVAALLSLYRRQFRLMASGFASIVVVPMCFLTVLRAPIFDPWLWYTILNESRFNAVAAERSYTQTPVEERDVSTGIVGLNFNHFIEIIYSKSNIDGQKTANSFITHLYGNFYRRDEFD